jgi:hypothetical protein
LFKRIDSSLGIKLKLNNSLVWERTPCRRHLVACLLYNRKDRALRSSETIVDIDQLSHGVISQKIQLYVVTVVRTQNPAKIKL